MLPYHGRWRNAPKRAPEREARLLMFAKKIIQPGDDDFSMPNGNTNNMPSDNDIDAMSPEELAKLELNIRKEEAKKKIKDLMGGKTNTARAETTPDGQGRSSSASSGSGTTAPGGSATTPTNSDTTNNPTSTPAASNVQKNASAETDEETEKEEKEKATLQETQAVTTDMIEVIGGLLNKLQSNGKIAKENITEQEYEQWKNLQDGIADTLGETQKDRDLLDIYTHIDENEQAKMPPNGVIAYARRKVKKGMDEATRKGEDAGHYEAMLVLFDNADEIIQGKTALNPKDVSSLAEWKKLSDDQKEKIYELIREAVHMDEGLLAIKKNHQAIIDLYAEGEGNYKKWDETITKKRDVILQNNAGETDSATSGFNPKSLLKMVANLPGNLGLEFYSPMQIWEAFKKVTETMEDIGKKKNALKIASFADKLGSIVGIIPKYKNAKEALRVAHEEENEKIKKGYKEALGAANWQPGFDKMFGPGELMDQSLGDKNMTMAIIEYAAGKGMIYNMKDTNWKEEKLLGRWNFRDLVPASWDDNQIGSYYGNIAFDNEQGEKKQEKIGYDNNITFSKIHQFMKELNESLEGKDVWYARGVVKRAMEKVDQGWMSSIISVTVMRHIEKNPILGQIMPMKWLDQVGGEGKELNMGLLKFEQHLIKAWAKEGGRDIREVPRLGNFMADVRDYLTEKDSSLKGTDDATVARLDNLTAQLMSGVVVKVGPKGSEKTCTIYDKRFDQYVGEILKEPNWARGVPMDKSWDDFFVSPSEFQRGSQTIYDAIFAFELSSGGFKHEPRAKFFLSNIERTHFQLMQSLKKEKNPADKAELKSAIENFRSQMREKLNASMERLLRQRVGTFMATRYKLEYNNSPVFMTLIEQGLLDISIFQEAIEKNTPGSEFAKAVVEQCLNSGMVRTAMHTRDLKGAMPEDDERLHGLEEEAKAIKSQFSGKDAKKNNERRRGEDTDSGYLETDYSTAT